MLKNLVSHSFHFLSSLSVISKLHLGLYNCSYSSRTGWRNPDRPRWRLQALVFFQQKYVPSYWAVPRWAGSFSTCTSDLLREGKTNHKRATNVNHVTFFVVVQKHQRSIRNLVGGRLECCDGFLVYSPTPPTPICLAPTYTSSSSPIQPLGVCAESRNTLESTYTYTLLLPKPQPPTYNVWWKKNARVGFWAHSHTHTPTHTSEEKNIQYAHVHNRAQPLCLTHTRSSAGL